MTDQILTNQNLEFKSPVTRLMITGLLETFLGVGFGIFFSWPILTSGFPLSSPSSFLRLFLLPAFPIGLLVDGIAKVLKCVPIWQSRVTIESDEVVNYPGLNLPPRRIAFSQIGYGLCYQAKDRSTGYVQLFYYPIQADGLLDTSKLLRINLLHTTQDEQLFVQIRDRATGPRPDPKQMRAYFGWRPLLKAIVGLLALFGGLMLLVSLK